MLESSKLTAADIMTRDVVTFHPHTSIRYVAKVFAEKHISGAPVVDEDGRIAGIVSEADLISWHDGGDEKRAWWLEMIAEGSTLKCDVLNYIQGEGEKVRNVMTPDTTTVRAEASVTEIAALLIARKVKRLPVTRGGKLVGIVSRSDLIRALAQG